VIVTSQKKKQKKYAEPPITLESWEREKMRRLAARRASISFALRTLTEAMDEIIFDSWTLWDDIFKKYNLDPNKEYYELQGQVLERKRP
jgi:hypothetical protein